MRATRSRRTRGGARTGVRARAVDAATAQLAADAAAPRGGARPLAARRAEIPRPSGESSGPGERCGSGARRRARRGARAGAGAGSGARAPCYRSRRRSIAGTAADDDEPITGCVPE